MSDQTTLFDQTEKKRTRVQKGFKKSHSKDGTLSIQIDTELAVRIRRHCQQMNINCKKFITDIIETSFEEIEAHKYDALTKEELIDMLRRMETER